MDLKEKDYLGWKGLYLWPCAVIAIFGLAILYLLLGRFINITQMKRNY